MKHSTTTASWCAAVLSACLVLAAGCSGGGPSPASPSSPAGPSSSASFSQLADTAASEEANLASGAGNDALAGRLLADVEPLAEGAGMDVGVCAVDLSSGARASVAGDAPMVAASMIKLAVAASFLEQVEAGAYALEDTYAIQADDIVGGTGSLGARGEGAEVTYGELLEKMVSESDNTAANILIGAVGMQAVNETARGLGLKSTELNRLMMDEEAIAQGVENYTSANDVGRLLELAYGGELVNPDASKVLLEALGAQQDDAGILGGLPAGTRFAHKTGSLAQARHDGGIVYGKRDFVLVVLCGGPDFTLDGAHDAMSAIAAAVYGDIEGPGNDD